MVGFFEHDNGSSGSLKAENFLIGQVGVSSKTQHHGIACLVPSDVREKF